MFEASDKLILLFILGYHIVQGVPRAHLKQGVVQGTNRQSYDGRTFSAFEGIPYAKPPIDELRFKEPVAAPCWNSVLIANRTYMCSQLDGTLTVIGTEDCLYLNVYVPKNYIIEDDEFDVLVHIHGGSLSIGSASTMSLPDYLMDKDLILVAFNYRLGAADRLHAGEKENHEYSAKNSDGILNTKNLNTAKFGYSLGYQSVMIFIDLPSTLKVLNAHMFKKRINTFQAYYNVAVFFDDSSVDRFLSTGDSVVPGNNGLKDQTLALRWIKDNIKSFGGNPNSITITGFSSGGGSVQMHYLSPLSKGLFHRGFTISAVVTNSGMFTLIPLQKAKLLAEKVKCEYRSVEAMVRCLRKTPIEDLVNANIWFKPAVESGNPKAFLPENPYKMLRDKKVYNVPWIASNVINESLFSLESVYRNRSEIFAIRNNWTEWGKRWLDLEDYVDVDKLEYTLNKIKEFYLDDITLENGLQKLNKLMTDRHFLVGTDLALRTHAAASRSSVHFYLFKFVPEDSLQFFGPPAASHGVDDKLMFKFTKNPRRLQPRGEKMMRLFIDFLAKYAKTGVPRIGSTNWYPINPRRSNLNVLEINSPEDIKMKSMEELAPRHFWDSLPIKENNHLF